METRELEHWEIAQGEISPSAVIHYRGHSERRSPWRPQSKDLQLHSGQHPVGGAFEIRRLKIVPIFAQVDPPRVGLCNERSFLFAAPAFQLLFARDRL